MKSGHAPIVCALATLSCLTHDPLRHPPPPLHLRAVRGLDGPLDALTRFADLTLSFDRPIALPDPDAVLLVAMPPSDALLADAAHGALSTANAARRVPCALWLDARDATRLHLRATRPLQPDLALTLVVTPAVYATDEGVLSVPEDAPRVLSSALRVAPARRCGPLVAWSVIDSDVVPTGVRALLARFDRAVHVIDPRAPIVRMIREDGREAPQRAQLECPDPDGGFRCLSVSPTRALLANTHYTLHVENLAARNGHPLEDPGQTIVARDLASWPRSAFSGAPVCASDETLRGAFCVRAASRAIEVRALTTRRAVLVAQAWNGLSTRESVGDPGVGHRLRVPIVSDGTVHAVTVWALGLDGTADAHAVVWPVAVPNAAPRVRLGEVLAHPSGAATQEFVELVSDEPAPLSLAGWSLAQGPARTVFPMSARVGARGRAVVVSSMFDPRGSARGADPAVASGASLVVLPSLIARGLRDGGSDLALLDPSGIVRSVLPGASPELAARTGTSVVRADTELDDEDPAGWTYDAANASTPGAPDALR